MKNFCMYMLRINLIVVISLGCLIFLFPLLPGSVQTKLSSITGILTTAALILPLILVPRICKLLVERFSRKKTMLRLLINTTSFGSIALLSMYLAWLIFGFGEITYYQHTSEFLFNIGTIGLVDALCLSMIFIIILLKTNVGR